MLLVAYSCLSMTLDEIPHRNALRFPSKAAFVMGAIRRTWLETDQRVSRLEELQLRAEATDDFGLVKYGIGFGPAGQEPKMLDLGQAAPANEKQQFGHMILLEEMGAQIDDLVSYFAWADDYGPGGEVRRTYGDMFFAEVRPFEEIFRRDQSGGGGEGGEPGQQGDETTRLAELQKQIVIATWKLQREKSAAK